MTTHTHKSGGVRSWTGISVMLLLAGCGGEDNNGSNEQQALAISTGNAASVTAKVFNTSFIAAGMDSSSNAVVGASLSPTAQAPKEPHFNLARFLRNNPGKIHTDQTASPSVAAAVFTGKEVSCEISGTFTYTWNDKDDNAQLSVGDTISGTFNNCIDDPGVAVNGGLSYTYNDLTGDPALALTAWSTSATINFEQLRVAQGNGSWTLHGNGLSYTSSTPDGVNFSYSLSGATLTLTEPQDSSRLYNFAFYTTEDENTLAYTLHIRGKLSSEQLGGHVAFATTQLFKGAAEAMPTEGRLTIHGAKVNGSASSIATLTAMSGDAVTLELDTGGDGGTDETVDTTWAALGIVR